MGTLASELAPHVERRSDQPRVYVDANVPAGLVAFMRRDLGWDVLFVIEHDDLRRARDGEHFQLARELRRTLLTFDRDYLDDRAFPPRESGGVLVLSAPSTRGYEAILTRIDRELLRAGPPLRSGDARVPLAGRKLRLHVDWRGSSTEPQTRR